MHSHADIIKALEEPMDYKYRVQRINDYGASLVAYIDARQAAKRLTDVFGLNWTREYENRDNSLFCRITVKTPEGDWVSREDVGTESQAEAEKGESSDAFKRAAVSFGVGAFLYTLGEMQIPVTKKNNKNYPSVFKNDEKYILYSAQDLSNFATLVSRFGINKAQAMWKDNKRIPEPVKDFNPESYKPVVHKPQATPTPSPTQSPTVHTIDKTIEMIGELESRFGYDKDKLIEVSKKYTSNYKDEKKIANFERMISNVIECNVLSDMWLNNVPPDNTDATQTIMNVIKKNTGNENGFMLEFTLKNKELTLSSDQLSEIKETIEKYSKK